MCLLEVAMCEKSRSSHFQLEGRSKKIEDEGEGGTLAGGGSVLHYMPWVLRCAGTRFQNHLCRALTNFICNFLLSVLFVVNFEEHGNGNRRIVTKEIYPKIVGFRKKWSWSKFEFIATANLYFEDLKETAHLSLLLESDGLLIYQLVEAVKEVYDNHDDLCNNVDFDHLSCNVKKN